MASGLCQEKIQNVLNLHISRGGCAQSVTDREDTDYYNVYQIIACGLNNLQKMRDGEPLGGKTRAEDDFADDDENFLD